jgi:hypothetical protein
MSSVERFTSSSQRWARLYSRSFDSGFQTLKQIELMIRLNEFVVRLIRYVQFDPKINNNFIARIFLIAV